MAAAVLLIVFLWLLAMLFLAVRNLAVRGLPKRRPRPESSEPEVNKGQQMAGARADFETELRMIQAAGLNPHEQHAADLHARQKYLQRIKEILGGLMLGFVLLVVVAGATRMGKTFGVISWLAKQTRKVLALDPQDSLSWQLLKYHATRGTGKRLFYDQVRRTDKAPQFLAIWESEASDPLQRMREDHLERRRSRGDGLV